MSFLVVFSDQSCPRTLRQIAEVSRSTPTGSEERYPRFPSSMQSDLYCHSDSKLSVFSRYAIAIADTRQRILAFRRTSIVTLRGTRAFTSLTGIRKADAKPFA